jgi:hypothetical protein
MNPEVQKLMQENNGGRGRQRKYKWLLNGYVYCPIHERRFTAEDIAIQTEMQAKDISALQAAVAHPP